MPKGCEIGPEPQRRRASVSDVTIEALMRTVSANPRGLLNFRDELSGWLGNLSRYSNGSDRPAWLEAYGGRPYVIDRVKDGGKPVLVDQLSVAILGGIQPDRLTEMLDSADDGLVARFLPFWPEESQKVYIRKPERVSRVTESLQRLTELLPKRDGSPIMVPLTEKAHDVFETWWHNRMRTERFTNSRLQASFGKSDGHVIRIALILEFLDWAADEFEDDPPVEVRARSLRAAVQIREEYIKPMQFRVFGHSMKTPEFGVAKAIAEHICEKKLERFNVRQVVRFARIKGVHSHTGKDIVDAALAYLVSLNWITEVEVHSKTPGRRKRDFEVNERLWAALQTHAN